MNWSTKRAAKLVTAEGGNLPRWVEKRPRIKGTIAQELKSSSVEVIRASGGYGVDHAARLSAVFRRLIVRDDGVLLDRVYSKIAPVRLATGAGIELIVDADTVDTVVILLWPATVDRVLHSATAVARTASTLPGLDVR